MDKEIKSYQKIYRKALKKAGMKDTDVKVDSEEARISVIFT